MKHSLSLLLGVLTLATCGCASPARAAPTARVTCTIELDRALLPAEAVQRTVMKIALRTPELASPAERPPVNLAVVLDRSGSMGGDKIERAKEAAIEALHRLGSRDLFSLVIYDHEVETVVPPQSAANTEWIEGRIRKIQSRGNTALFAGVSQGAAEIRKNIENRKYVPRVLLLSDGQANVGPSTPTDLGRLGTALMKEGIAVTTVGVGADYNEDLMTRLSQASDGNAYFAASSSELTRIFAAELGGVLKVAARQVVLEVTCTGGVKPLRIIGREGRIRGETVEITLNQLYGGQEKFVLVEVEIPAARAEEVKDIAVASCRYADAITQSEDKASTRATVRFTRDDKAVAGSVNVAVQKDIAINAAAIASDRAISMNDAGDNRLAAALLKKESDRLSKVASEYNLPEVAQQAVELEAKSKVLESRALNANERKTMRTDSYQQRNQQLEK
ncbi:MAG: VWA domain-containing protein [bacterium]